MQSIGLFFKILWSPREAMLQASKNPRIVAPMLCVCFFSMLNGSAMLISSDALREQMSVPQMALFLFGSFAAPLIVILIVAGAYFSIFTIIGREGGFKTFFSITAFAFAPFVFSSIAALFRAVVGQPSSLSLNQIGSISPAVWLDRDSVSPVLFAGVNAIDLVSIWILALLATGYGFVATKNLSSSARTGAIVGVFLAYVGLVLVMAAVGVTQN